MFTKCSLNKTFRTSTLGFGQPNSLWWLSNGQVDNKIYSYSDIHYNMEIDFDEIICRFTRHHPRRVELASVLSEWLRNPGKGTLGSYNPKNFLGEHALDPPSSLHLPGSLFQKSVTIFPRSIPDRLYLYTSTCIPSLPLKNFDWQGNQIVRSPR